MRRAIGPCALLAALAALTPGAAEACGAFYGSQVEVAPDQRIVVVHRAGLETYLFQPRFCGVAAEFGVILPIPAPLSSSPALADPALFGELDRLTEPTTVEVCASSGSGCGAAGESAGPGDGDVGGGFGTGVDVLDQGRVGQFEYSVVQATTGEAFTGWLTTNGYPYDAGKEGLYQSYADQGWYFVAFRVTADASALKPGQRLCGDLGPIQLAFPSSSPYVPARIADVNAPSGARPRWRVFLVAPAQQRLTATSAFQADLYFSGALDHAATGDFPALAALFRDGERLTAVNVSFPYAGVTTDITFEDAPQAADFRSQVRVTKDCGGCAAGGGPTLVAALVVAAGALRASRRRARRGGESLRGG